jgi:hypothetical protein
MLRIWSRPKWESCSLYSYLALQKYEYFWSKEMPPFWFLQFRTELEIWGDICNRAGPTSQQPKLVLTARPSHQTRATHHQPSHHAVTMLTAESVPAPITAGRRRCPKPRCPYPLEHGLGGEFPPHFASSLSRCVALLSASAVDCRRSPPAPTSSSKARRSTTSTSPSCSAAFELEPPANEAPRAPTPVSRCLTKRSPMTALIHRSPAKPPIPRASTTRPGSPPLATTQPRHCRSASSTRVCHRHKPNSVSPCSIQHHQSTPRGPGVTTDPAPSAWHRRPAGITSVPPACHKGKFSFVLVAPGMKRLMGRALVIGPVWLPLWA